MYAHYAPDSILGISIFCRTWKNEIIYSVTHSVDIGGKCPVIVCEPVNDKDVHIVLFDLYDQIQLPQQRRIELLKNSNHDEYETHKKLQRETEETEPKAVDYGIMITYDFVSWEIVFDKNTGKCLRKKTPDRTKEYQKQQ